MWKTISDGFMALPWNTKLWIINGICQGYFYMFTLTSLITAIYVTLPDFSQGDKNTLYWLEVLAWYVFINLCGNYYCIIYRFRSSIAKNSDKRSKTAPSLSSAFTDHTLTSGYETSLLSTSKTSIADGMSGKIHNGSNQTSNTDNCNNTLPSDKKDGFTYNDWNFNNSTRSANPNVTEVSSANSVSVNLNLNPSATNNGLEILGGWTFCKDCDMRVPPRAKHCPLCDYCVLKHDHHCFFAGCCVGFHNQRHFVFFCLYGSFGAIYNIITLLSYLEHHFEAYQGWGYFVYFPPVTIVLWLFGNVGWNIALALVFLFWSCVTLTVCGYYFMIQWFFILCGQTKYEIKKGIKTYQGTVRKNVRSVFGRFGIIGVLFPAPFLGYHGDGTNWDEMLAENKLL